MNRSGLIIAGLSQGVTGFGVGLVAVGVRALAQKYFWLLLIN